MAPRPGIKRIVDQEDLFADSLVPHYLQAKAKEERKDFFKAAFLLLFDRFPLQPEYMAKPVTLQSIRTATKRIKKSFGERIMKTASLHIGPPLGVEDWREYLTIPADRARRRKVWQECHGRIPSHHKYQYNIAFAEHDPVDPADADEVQF
ncbi:hypothetical protein BDN71DRAFT_1512956 [Pleurotus eryngii]|uniref:Uncharacterized protein n=1 Tax=Pleurotus eryngii TaxID=5323 RepID=A0A9P6DAB7_PLEER|nr:hypothetical protein BDN71DRAFT_1512956 [Pleurotus eryngii]